MTSIAIAKSQAYKPELINKHIKPIEKINWKKLLKGRDNPTSKEAKCLLVLTYNRSLPNNSKVARWNTLEYFIYKQRIQRNFSN